MAHHRDDLRFEAPGPGHWEMDATHATKPLTGVLREVFATGLRDGMRGAARRYGLLLDTLDVRYVHGFPYLQPVPLGAPPGAKLPPRFVFKAVTWLHPEMRRRLSTAARLFERRPWLDDLAAWDERDKPATI